MGDTQSRWASRYPEVPDDFGHWLAGLIDGEGCFSIHPNGETAWTAHFYLGLRADDRAVLEEITRVTELGRLYNRRPSAGPGRANDRPSVLWQVFRKTDKLQLIQLLERYPLRSKKARDFAIWREAVIYLTRYCGKGRYVATEGIAHLADQLKAVRAFDGRDTIALPEPDPTLFESDSSVADVAWDILASSAPKEPLP